MVPSEAYQKAVSGVITSPK